MRLPASRLLRNCDYGILKNFSSPAYSGNVLMRSCWIILFSLIFLCWKCDGSSVSSIVATFPNDEDVLVRGGLGGKFTHLQIHRTNGKVYLGAVNRLYQLDPDLGLEESVVTGPVVNISLFTVSKCDVLCFDIESMCAGCGVSLSNRYFISQHRKKFRIRVW